MKALSDPNRVRVLKLLQKNGLCVCEIQDFLQLAQSTVSKHMKILEDAELVDRHREGSWIRYSLPEKHSSIYGKELSILLENWLDDDLVLQQMLLHWETVMENNRSCSNTNLESAQP